MRIVIDGRRLTAERTGVGRYLESLLHAWAASRPPAGELVLVLHHRAGLARVPAVPGLQTVVVGENWPGLVWERFGLGRVLRPGDVLFAPANFVPQCWAGPTVLVIHDAIMTAAPGLFSWPQRLRYGWRFRQQLRRAAQQATRVLVPSGSTARDVERLFGVARTRLCVIPLGVDPGFEPRNSDSARVRAARQAVGLGDAPFFLFVGKRSRRRNVPEVLAALALFRHKRPGHRIVFVGPQTDRLRTDAARGMIVAGHVADEVLQGLLSGAEALVYPSLYEGFGLPIVEAMASGCPVITVRQPSLEETAGDAAWYVSEPSAAQLAGALEAIVSDPEARRSLVARGLLRAQRFGRAAFAARVRAELEAVALLAGAHRPTTPAHAARDGAASATP